MPHKKQKAIRSNNNKCYLRPNDRFGLNPGSLTPRNARHKIVDKRSGVAVSAETHLPFARSRCPFPRKRRCISAERALQERLNLKSAQWKSTGEVFLFHSILYLCIMNMLEQLARLVLPKEILDNFDIVKIETDESDIDSMSMTIHLDERMNAYLQKSEDYESKGFMDAVRITDFPIRDHKVILVLRRRRWKNKETGETFVDRISVTESGTRYSKEFAAFLKETYGHIPDDLPYA